MEAFFAELQRQGQDIRKLAGIELAAIGPATRKAIEERYLKVSYVPEEYRAERIAEGLASKIRPGERVLLARAEEARPALPEALRELGAEVWDIPAYRTVPGQADKAELQQLLKTKNSKRHNLYQFLHGQESHAVIGWRPGPS